jgi:hypothetical protein
MWDGKTETFVLPGFSVPNNEQVVVSVDNEKLKGTLHVLSRTGGAICLDKRYPPLTVGEKELRVGNHCQSSTYDGSE